MFMLKILYINYNTILADKTTLSFILTWCKPTKITKTKPEIKMDKKQYLIKIAKHTLKLLKLKKE